jgi:hypothetical protein
MSKFLNINCEGCSKQATCTKSINNCQDDEVEAMIPPFDGKVQDTPYFPAQEEEDLPTDIDNDIDPMLPFPTKQEERFQPDRRFADDDDIEPLMIPDNI